jgi:hypothetical protein
LMYVGQKADGFKFLPWDGTRRNASSSLVRFAV